MTATVFSPFSHGRYSVSPLARALECGGFAASVSIRSGKGQGTSDRIVRFLPRFPTAEHALHYALTQARRMLDGVRATA